MTTAAELISQAKQRITSLDPAQVATELESGDTVLIDLREPAELEQTGVVPGAVHAPRGMLEFWADPTSPYHRPEFDPERRTFLYSASGGRSALAAETLQHLGYRDVAHIDGGIEAWIDAGQPTVTPQDA